MLQAGDCTEKVCWSNVNTTRLPSLTPQSASINSRCLSIQRVLAHAQMPLPCRAFFRSGKVLPIKRGEGLNQVNLHVIARRLGQHGDWLHVFPEGRISYDGRLSDLRWGVGKMVCDVMKHSGGMCAPSPTTLPHSVPATATTATAAGAVVLAPVVSPPGLSLVAHLETRPLAGSTQRWMPRCVLAPAPAQAAHSMRSTTGRSNSAYALTTSSCAQHQSESPPLVAAAPRPTHNLQEHA